AILASNMKSSLDQAFMRRLRFIVNFPFPGLPERSIMWRKVFPSAVPKAELDFDRLARFNLTGGSIHNIALNAAFLAAAQADPESSVTQSLIFDAIRSELRKLDKPVNEAEFRILDLVGAKS
ncbi:MAG: ATP-binding protein, partial [Aquabacterium sp.]|nr:ATP-binding protein [Aquabacterium sp.]